MAMISLIGARIRRQRLDKGLRQTALAAACDISPSYLNLIEHDRRRIGGKLLADIAEALGVPPDQLSGGVEARDLARLRQAAAAYRGEVDAEVARTDEFALRFPGWAGLVSAQAQRTDELEQRLAVLADRARQDPVMAASLHNILSTVTAIRSTAGILAGDDPVEPAWQARFHRNLYEESQRLAAATEALVGDLEEGGTAEQTGQSSDPVVAAEAWLGNWSILSALEPGGEGPGVLIERASSDLGNEAAVDIVTALIEEVARDEADLPLSQLRTALSDKPIDPFDLAEKFDVRLACIIRRLAALGERGAGYVRSNAEGDIVLRRHVPGLNVPRFGASRVLWPLYAALDNPGRLQSHRIGSAERGWETFQAWAIADRSKGDLRATMLVLPVAAG